MKKHILITIILLTAMQGFSQSNCASRTSGVAPLSVFFNAVDPANGVVQPDEVNGHIEYSDFRYVWNFGDPGSGTWAVNSKSKNTDEGYVVSHVYDHPGSYTVTLQVTDTAGNQNTYTEEITVLDPDAVFSGTNTICISSTGNFDGAPAGALQITSTDISEIFTHIGDNKRVLLRRGDTWTTTTSGELRDISGPAIIGAYGDGINPNDRGIYENAPIINISAIEENFFECRNVNDIRIMDVTFYDSDSAQGIIGGAIEMYTLLMYRIYAEGFATPIGNTHWATTGHDQLAVVSCHLSEAESNVVYIGSERLTLMGNYLKNAHRSHVLRVWQSYNGVIAHNDISGSSTQTDMGRHALKLHGPDESIIADDGIDDHLANRTRYTLITNNIFGSSGPWPVTISPQYAAIDERLRDIVFENNKVIAEYGDSPRIVDKSVYVVANYVTIRNNVFDASGANQEYAGVVILHEGIVPYPYGNRVYNNTFYKMDLEGGYSEFIGVDIQANCEQSFIANNLVQFVEGGTIRTAARDNGVNSTVENNILTSEALFIDPDNADPLFRDFNIDSNSIAVDSGITVPLFTDIAGNVRPQGAGIDVGAYEYVPEEISGIRTSNSSKDLRAYPNPFNGSITVYFSLSHKEKISVSIADILGRVIEKRIIYGEPGENYFKWNPDRKIGSGFYSVLINGKSTNAIYKVYYLK